MAEKYCSIPSARLLLSSLRSVGYTAETAIADIIDNSITAKADIISINFNWDLQQITIYDNGIGMNKNDLLAAMAIGSSDPDEQRDYLDLGRFGMGMKTAAFSLGKCLTVISKVNNTISNACWDLEYIKCNNNWELLISDDSDGKVQELSKCVENYSNGTAVCISSIDKFITSSRNRDKDKKKFYKTIANIKNHLSLVFHRFIEDKDISIYVNDTLLKPWNPYILENRAVQELEKEEVNEAGHRVIIQPYILPHKTKFAFDEDFNNAGGYKGWLQHQGFYVYRNKRLIVFGTWFGIFKNEISYNLARIQLDIFSDSDFDWQIDIKKSKAVPPVYAEEVIKRTAENAVKQSVKVYNSRGSYSNRKESNVPQLSCVWEQRKDSFGIYSFYLNKKHTLLNKLKISLDRQQKETLAAYLQLVEKCSPMTLSGITDTISSKTGTEISESEINSTKYKAKELIKVLVLNGYTKDEIKNLFQQLADYSCVADDFDEMYSEVN